MGNYKSIISEVLQGVNAKELYKNHKRQMKKQSLIPIPICNVNNFLRQHKLTIKATAGEKLIITDQATGEEYVVGDLGYPF